MINKALILLLLISLTFNLNLRSQNISKESLSELTKESREIEQLFKTDSKAATEKQNNLVAKYKDVQFSLDDFANLPKDADIYKNRTLRVIFYPSFVRISKDQSVNGAKASCLKMLYYPDALSKEFDDQVKWAKVYKEFTYHPALGQFVKGRDYQAAEIFSRLQFLLPEAIKETHLLNGIYSALKLNTSYKVSSAAITMFKVVASEKLNLPQDSIQIFRELISQKTKDVIDSMETLPLKYPADKRTLDLFKNSYEYINSDYSKGKLLNNKAPEIEFLWCSNPEIKKLSDTKGKVVIIDFWATWCSPCVGSFPNVRMLQERYKEYPVIIIGITSPQGYHMDRKNKARYDTKDDPEKEISYMPSFIKDMEITWEVAFSKTTVFNPQYGVRGIPHVAIIDANGIVRYNELRPYDDPAHEAEKIDALLKEAGLPFPANPISTR
jgi:thiol-disulfide isomerase/thioredoxin